MKMQTQSERRFKFNLAYTNLKLAKDYNKEIRILREREMYSKIRNPFGISGLDCLDRLSLLGDTVNRYGR